MKTIQIGVVQDGSGPVPLLTFLQSRVRIGGPEQEAAFADLALIPCVLDL